MAAGLAALLFLGMAGTALFVGSRVIADNHREDRIEQVRERLGSQLPPGQRKKLDQRAPRPGGPESRQGNGDGLGSLNRGVRALGDVQHGEFTVQGADGKATVMTVQRGTVTVASATSVTVRSADGFTATYTVDASTRGKAGNVAKDDTVLVIAQKSGAKAVMIRAARKS